MMICARQSRIMRSRSPYGCSWRQTPMPAPEQGAHLVKPECGVSTKRTLRSENRLKPSISAPVDGRPASEDDLRTVSPARRISGASSANRRPSLDQQAERTVALVNPFSIESDEAPDLQPLPDVALARRAMRPPVVGSAKALGSVPCGTCALSGWRAPRPWRRFSRANRSLTSSFSMKPRNAAWKRHCRY